MPSVIASYVTRANAFQPLKGQVSASLAVLPFLDYDANSRMRSTTTSETFRLNLQITPPTWLSIWIVHGCNLALSRQFAPHKYELDLSI